MKKTLLTAALLITLASCEKEQDQFTTIQIGNQIWTSAIAEIPQAGDYKKIGDTDIYGLLYNFEAAQSVCPTGFKLPREKEFGELFLNIGDEPARKLKAIDLWLDPNEASDDYGYSLYGAGGFIDGIHYYFNEVAYLWTCTPFDDTEMMVYWTGNIDVNFYPVRAPKDVYLSVRCFKYVE